jgi:hypothetical protein
MAVVPLSARGGAALLRAVYPGLRPVVDWRGVNVRLTSGGEGTGRVGHISLARRRVA